MGAITYTKTKAVVAGIGLVVTALTSALSDDILNVDEVGQVISTVIVVGASVYAVWRAPNKVKTPE